MSQGLTRVIVNNNFLTGAYLPLSGGTVSGNTQFTQNLSAGTIFSGSTNLYNIFAQAISVNSNGTNTYTGGTFFNTTINVSALTISTLVVSGSSQLATTTATSISGGTVSGGTLFSGTTNLYSIFQQIGTDTPTFVQPGSNITTGGTALAPIISVVPSPSFNNILFSGTASGGSIYATSMILGIPGQTGTTATIYGDLLVIGQSISAFTSQLYVEDNNIILNFNPTASTTSTSLGAGITIQDGSGISGTNVFFDIRGTATTVDNRSFATNLNDIRIRETGTTSSPAGVRVLAENDILNGGTF